MALAAARGVGVHLVLLPGIDGLPLGFRVAGALGVGSASMPAATVVWRQVHTLICSMSSPVTRRSLLVAPRVTPPICEGRGMARFATGSITPSQQ